MVSKVFIWQKLTAVSWLSGKRWAAEERASLCSMAVCCPSALLFVAFSTMFLGPKYHAEFSGLYWDKLLSLGR